jgi:hypothetical protein
MNRSGYKGPTKVQKPSLLLQVYEGRCKTRNFHSMWQGGTVGARLVAGFVSFPMCLCHCEYLHKWVFDNNTDDSNRDGSTAKARASVFYTIRMHGNIIKRRI